MDSVFQNMTPAVAASVAGYLLARRQPIDIRTIAGMLIYFISPIVILGGILKAELTPAIFFLPVLAFALGTANSWLGSLWAGRLGLPGDGRLIVASSASSANTLYFGLGLAIAVLPPHALPLFLLACVGFSLSESVWGFYFLARGQFSLRAAAGRVARLPVIHAIVIGAVARALGCEYPQSLAPLFDAARGALILMGSAILGAALAQQRKMTFDPRLIGAVLAGRHLSFAGLIAAAIALDAATLRLLSVEHYAVMSVFAVLPVANNTLSYAAVLGIPTCRISTTLVASNAVALALAPALLLFLRALQ